MGGRVAAFEVTLTMLRLALTYQLILAVLVGPLLCCCSAGKSQAASPAPVRAPVERGVTSCCSHKKAHAKSEHAPKQAPAKPTQPAEKCPCHSDAGKARVVLPEPGPTALSTLSLALSLDALAPLEVLADAVFASCADSSSGPSCPRARLTTSELLYAHHNLRC